VKQKGRNSPKPVGLSIGVSGSEYTFVFRERKELYYFLLFVI
jgi:hypothetical protein